MNKISFDKFYKTYPELDGLQDTSFDYLINNYDKIFNPNYGKEDKEKFDMITCIREYYCNLINNISEGLSEFYQMMIMSNIMLNISHEITIDEFRNNLKFIWKVMDFYFIYIKSILDQTEFIESIKDEINNNFICKRYFEEFYNILDDNDKLNKESFMFPNILLNENIYNYFIDKYLLKYNMEDNNNE